MGKPVPIPYVSEEDKERQAKERAAHSHTSLFVESVEKLQEH